MKIIFKVFLGKLFFIEDFRFSKELHFFQKVINFRHRKRSFSLNFHCSGIGFVFWEEFEPKFRIFKEGSIILKFNNLLNFVKKEVFV